VEMGISDFNEMSRLSKIVKPDICVITNIGPCHLENLKDLDGVLKAKSEIFESMNKRGFAVLNGDDEKLRTIKRVNDKTPIYYGLDDKNDIYAKDIESKSMLFTTCKICTTDSCFDVCIPLPGKHHVLNALAAAKVGLLLNMSEDEIKAGIESVKSTEGRSNIIETNKHYVIDDCYNANPKSMKAALDLLKLAEGKKIAILGDMFELGENEEELHAKVGEYVSIVDPELLICIGNLSSNIYEKANICGKKYYFETLDEALCKICELTDSVIADNNENRVKPTVLVKASHGMHFEKIVEKLKLN
ncbi:MAG: Mur ligase family protein, partial [Lachnospiraceae bacterium]|nr:Mur ligase family protein [Lachnospiraceae bacterium]